MSVMASRRVVRRRDRRSDGERAGGPGAAGIATRPALAALAVVLIGSGLHAVAVAGGDAARPMIVPFDGAPAAGEPPVDAVSVPSSPPPPLSSSSGTAPRPSGASVATGGGAAADEEIASDAFTRRPYVALGVGASRVEPVSPSVALTVAEDTSFGGEIGLGYDITRWLSAEFHAADLGAAEIEFLGTDVGDIGYRVYGASAIFYLLNTRDGFVPFASDRDGAHRREGLSLFGRFGIGGLLNDSDRVAYRRDYASHAVFGAGLEYGFRNGVALRAELQGFDTDARYLGVSVLKRFGRVRTAAPLAAVAPVTPPPVAALPVPSVEPRPLPVPDLPIVHFDFDRSELREGSLARLDAFVEAVADDERAIAIDGHTDWIGPETYNEGLSDRRANAVRDYLVSRGIEPDRLTARGFGERRPITTDTSDAGRALNRRAELRLD